MGKLMLNVLGSVAPFEREMMLERQREGIAKAKSEGRYKGPQAYHRDEGQSGDPRAGRPRGSQHGRRSPSGLGIGKGSIHRTLKERV